MSADVPEYCWIFLGVSLILGGAHEERTGTEYDQVQYVRFVALLQDNNRNDKNDKSKSDPPGIAFCFMAMPDGTTHAAMSEFDIYRFGRDFIFVPQCFFCGSAPVPAVQFDEYRRIGNG